MRNLIPPIVILAAVCVADAGIVNNLHPDEKGDRVAVVEDGKAAYLPATRNNIGSRNVNGGSCRYIRRASDGDLYVTGPGLGLFRSIDGGHQWTQTPLNIKGIMMMSSFQILHDDTFLVVFMPSRDSKVMMLSRSTDRGKTWATAPMQLDLSPCNYVFSWNGDLIQLDDGTLLLTLDMRVGFDSVHDDEGRVMPMQHRGSWLYVFRSEDGGRTWGEKSMLPGYGGEAHLLQLPSGKVLTCVRKQRWWRLPGDPADFLDLKKRYGWNLHVDNGLVDGGVRSNLLKNMFVSESYDGGHTWVNEQQVTSFKQCSGDMTYTSDGILVLQYLHRYDGGPIADRSIRARVSYDDGATWEPQVYVLSIGENYPGSIATADGGIITMCPHRGQVQAVHWRPRPVDHGAGNR